MHRLRRWRASNRPLGAQALTEEKEDETQKCAKRRSSRGKMSKRTRRRSKVSSSRRRGRKRRTKAIDSRQTKTGRGHPRCALRPARFGRYSLRHGLRIRESGERLHGSALRSFCHPHTGVRLGSERRGVLCDKSGDRQRRGKNTGRSFSKVMAAPRGHRTFPDDNRDSGARPVENAGVMSAECRLRRGDVDPRSSFPRRGCSTRTASRG